MVVFNSYMLEFGILWGVCIDLHQLVVSSGSLLIILLQLQVEASATFHGHTQVVGGIDWAERDTIYSASWDHSLRTWDVETAVATQTLVQPMLKIQLRLLFMLIYSSMETASVNGFPSLN